jgi:hypothetical protein
MRSLFIYIFLFCSISLYAQNPFRGINYQALISINTSSDVTYSEISAVYFEFIYGSNVFYSEEKALSNFSGKIDVFIANNDEFSSKLYQEVKKNIKDVTMNVYLVVSGQKRFAESQIIQSTLFANVSKYIVTIPSVKDLSHVLINNLQIEQLLAWNGVRWVNINDTVTDYSVITGTGNYSFVNRSSYAPIADTANYADTVLYAHTILNDLSLFGNTGRLEVGTLNEQALVVKTNSVERFSITDEGKIFLNQSLSEADVSMYSDKGVLSVNQLGEGNYPNILNSNFLFWFPKKNVLRIGEYSSINKQEDTLGDFSFAFGRDNIISGQKGSVAFGRECFIDSLDPALFYDLSHPNLPPRHEEFTSGSYSFTVGYQTQASGSYTISSGYKSSAGFWRSVAMGFEAIIEGISPASLALGYRARVYAEPQRTSEDNAAIGYNVTALNTRQSFILGSYASSNRFRNVFNYGDISSTNIVSNTAQNQFMVRAAGGVVFYTSPDLSTGAVLNGGSGSWSNLSNKKSKTKIKKLKPEDYLPLLNNLNIYEWEYISEPGVTHIGPMAQSFYQAFGLGDSDKHISMVDTDGVTLLMIKGLYSRFNQLEKSIHKLSKPKNEIDFTDIEQRIYLLEQKLNQYEN